MKRRSFLTTILSAAAAVGMPVYAGRKPEVDSQPLSTVFFEDPEVAGAFQQLMRQAEEKGLEILVAVEDGCGRQTAYLGDNVWLTSPDHRSGWSVSPHHDRWFKPHNRDIADHLGYEYPAEGPITRKTGPA